MSKLTRPEQCLGCVIQRSECTDLSPAAYDEVDDYEDAMIAAGRKYWGPLDAACKSVLAKWAREDWAEYYALED